MKLRRLLRFTLRYYSSTRCVNSVKSEDVSKVSDQVHQQIAGRRRFYKIVGVEKVPSSTDKVLNILIRQ